MNETTSTSGEIQRLYDEAVNLHRQGQLDAAASLYGQVLARDRRHAGALQLSGVVRLQQGKPEEAVKLIRRSLDIAPRQPQALNNLGSALLDLKRYDEAIATLRLAVEVQPDSPDAYGNLGRALRRRKLLDEAADCYRKAIELAPERPGLYSALGVTLAEAGQSNDAIASHQRALALAPDRADLRNNLAQAYRLAGRADEAEQGFRDALALDPKRAEFHLALGRVLTTSGRFGDAIESYREARDAGAENLKFEVALMFYQNHVLENDPVNAVRDARLYAKRQMAGVTPYRTYKNVPDPDRRLRIGWVSADLRTHPVGRFLVAVMHELDPAKLEMYAYSHIDNDDAINTSIKASIPNWRATTSLSDEELARRVRRDEIDVLVDLSGHTGGNRLRMFGYKPAPVSVTWLGYFATTGYDTIDYVLCNRWLLPESEENQWVEKPWRLPDTHWCYTVPSVDVPVAETPALSGAPFTFGSYNNFDKINEPTIALWSEVLRAVPGSRLLLRSSIKNQVVAQRMIEAFRLEGIEGERLIVDTDAIPYEQHLESYGKLDIALDPFPYNGGTTTTEALYMGVPVLTRRGDRFVAHLGETNIQSAGLPEWVAMDNADFVAKAKAYASDLVALNALRQRLRPQVLASRLFDAKAFARDLEDAFRGMWQKWCAEQPQARQKVKSATKSSGS